MLCLNFTRMGGAVALLCLAIGFSSAVWAEDAPALNGPAPSDLDLAPAGAAGNSSDESTAAATPTEPATSDEASNSAGGTSDEAGENSVLSRQLEAAKRRATDTAYEFRYKFQPGETIEWRVTHLATVETKIRGSAQTARSRSVSTKAWKVVDVDADGNATLVHSVPQVDMWQHVTGRQEVRYNSATDEKPPVEYAALAKLVGVPLTEFSVNRHGVVVNRRKAVPAKTGTKPGEDVPTPDLGMGPLIMPIPATPLKVGNSWTVPQDVKVRLENGEVRSIQTRERYTLDKVEAGIATIGVATQLLTPVNDPKIEAQLVQRLTQGTLKFDLDAGRIVSRQIDLDKTVIGFSGADSIMQYLARFTEEPAVAEASTPADTSPTEKNAAAPDASPTR